MALVPAIGVVIITSLFFNLELKTWYSGAVKEAVVNSNIVLLNGGKHYKVLICSMSLASEKICPVLVFFIS